MTLVEERNALNAWNVPLVLGVGGLSPKLHEALEAWATNPKEKLVIFEETDKVVSSDLAAWLIHKLILENQITTFCYKINGISFTRNNQLFNDDEDFSVRTVRSKIYSADVIWLEELAVAKLTDSSQTLLYSLLENLSTLHKKVIISCSMNAPTACGFTGIMVKKLLERKFHIVQA